MAINKTLLSFSILLVLAAALFLTNIGSYSHLLRAESNFVLGTRMMVDTNEWLLPHAQHEAALNRPPLQYWVIGLAYKVFGVGVFASRAPSALCGVALLALVYWLGTQLFEARIGLCAGAVLGTSYIVWAFSRLAMPDMLLTLCISSALTCWLLILTGRTTRPHLVSALGAAAVALGVLCKGPIAVVLAVLPIVLEVLVTRDWTILKQLKPFTALSVALLLTAPYFLLIWTMHGSELLENFLLKENTRRFMGTSWWHQDFIPPFYEIGAFLAGFFPWSPMILVALWSSVRSKLFHPQAPRHMRLLLLWIISPILFFSLSRFKLDYYFLPSMPPAVLLLAHSLSDSDTMTAESRRIRYAIWAIVLLIVVTTIVLTLPVIETNFGGLRLRWLPYGVALLSLGASALLTRGKSAQRTVLAGAFSVWLTTISALLVFLPTYAQGRPVTALAASMPPGATAYFVGEAGEWAWDLALYPSVSKPIEFVSKEEAIQELKSLSTQDHSAAILMYKQEYERALKAGLQIDRVAEFEVRKGDNLTWKSLQHPIRDVLYVVTPRVPREATP